MSEQFSLRLVPPMPLPKTEAEQRDVALALLEQHRATAIRLGRRAAEFIYAERGRVTSVEVLAHLRAQGHGPMIDGLDARWMGAVFRSGSGWRRVGWEPTGSHCRPVAIWSR